MTTAEATTDIRDVLAGRPGGVNRVIKRFGKPVVDYATALIPDRSAPFERMVEDILVDIVSQCRAAARSQSDDEVFEFAMEAALRTVRSRYREVLDAEASPSRATTSWSFKEAMERTRLSQEDITRGISEGRIKAVRENDEMRIKGEGIEGLGDRSSFAAYHVTAAERELLCLHYTLGFSPATIARWGGVTTGQVEDKLAKASTGLSEAMASRRSGAGEDDGAMRRYIDGRMGDDETAKFERKILKNKIAQQRLDDLRGESMAIRELFDAGPFDLSSIAVNVRARNPHHALSLPPMAALWLQVVGIVAMVIVFHSVGAYIAPPDVRVSVVAGEIPELASGRFLTVGEAVTTPEGTQALLVLDASNRVLVAPGSEVGLLEPRPGARQVLRLENGEIWGRFTSSGRAFVVQFPGGENRTFEIGSGDGAEFDLIVGDDVEDLLPLAASHERSRDFAAAFDDNLTAIEPISTRAGFRVGEGQGLSAGDRVLAVDGETVRNPAHLAELMNGMRPGDSVEVSVRSGDEQTTAAVTRVEESPLAVLRVFAGALHIDAGGERVLINRDQWAVFAEGQPPMLGVRGREDFRLLRIDDTERFKDSVHWLNTESYPLRAENSVVAVDRRLRELAGGLEAMRTGVIRRDGLREIRHFEENILRPAIQAAQERIEAGEPREPGSGSTAIGDESLVKEVEALLGEVAHWRRQAAAGNHVTLGAAAKTLQGAIRKRESDIEALGEQMSNSLVRQDEIETLEEAIELKNEEIAELRSSEFFDEDGKRRHELDTRISALDEVVRRGQEARSSIEHLTLRLNRMDSRIDDERRKLADRRAAVESAEQTLSELNDALEANIYTPEALRQAREAHAREEAQLAAAQEDFANAEAALAHAADRLAKAERELEQAEAPLSELARARNEAATELTETLANRTAAQKAADDAKGEAERLKAELEAMEEDDPDREARQAEYDAAVRALAEAEAKLEEAQSDATAATRRHETAEDAFEKAEDAAMRRAETVREREEESAAAKEAAADAEAAVEARETALKNAAARIEDLQKAKTERERLTSERENAESKLTAARADLETLNERIAELDAEAQPLRDEFADKLEVVEEGDDARDQIEELRTERDRYQALHDEIDLRISDRAQLREQRDLLAESELVQTYDSMVEEYATLSRRIGALKYLQTRATNEDRSLAAEQAKAVERFGEAYEEAAEEALVVLRQHCPRYEDENYGPVRNDGESLRDDVLRSLWKLYYHAETDGAPDGSQNQCYYVIVESGGDRRSLDELDSRWSAYLTEAFGREGYEKVARLTRADLRRPKNKAD